MLYQRYGRVNNSALVVLSPPLFEAGTRAEKERLEKAKKAF